MTKKKTLTMNKFVITQEIFEKHVSSATNADNAVFDAIEECAEHAIKFLNSFVGMMRTVTNDYNATKMNVDEIVNSLNDPDKIGLVKDILEKLG